MEYAIGLGALIVGFVIGKVLSSSDKKQLAELKEQLDAAQDELKKKKGGSGGKGDGASSKDLTAAQAKIKELEKTVADQKQQLSEAKSGKSSGGDDKQADAKIRQAEKLAQEAQQRAAQLEHALATVQQEHSALKASFEQHQNEIKKLRAEASTRGDQRGSDTTDTTALFADASGSIDKILKLLTEHEGQRASVLADSNGIVVAASGDSSMKDGIAASAQIIAQVSGKLKDMVPMSGIASFSVQDDKNTVLAARTFQSSGELLALATFGSRLPAPKVLESATNNLKLCLE